MFRVRTIVRVIRQQDQAHKIWVAGIDRVIRTWASNIRVTAKRSIRPRKRSSDVGRPPNSHLGFLRNLLRFARKAVGVYVVGPLLTRGHGRDVPVALEKGGRTRSAEGERFLVRARPYMRPAEAKERRELPGLLRNMRT